MIKVQPEMKIKVWHWVVKVSTEAPDMSYLHKFPVEKEDVERYGDPTDNEWWKCLHQLVEEGWLSKQEERSNYTDYRFTIKLRNMVCQKHGSIVTFGSYSKHPIFTDAHREIDGKTYYCDSCVDDLKPEYDRYRSRYR